MFAINYKFKDIKTFSNQVRILDFNTIMPLDFNKMIMTLDFNKKHKLKTLHYDNDIYSKQVKTLHYDDVNHSQK